MCIECHSFRLDRRAFIRLAGMAAAMSALAPAMPVFAAAAAPAISADEALARLKEGNKRFIEDADGCAADFARRREDVAGGQAPWATILTCSDSRVVPELIFGGASLGELFVTRNAGNVVNTDVLGTVEYGSEHLLAPLIVVMGHKRCGAVAAACDVVANGTRLQGSIGKMVKSILPVALAETDRGENFVETTARANARNGAKRLVDESRIISHLVEAGTVKIVPAYYDLDTGAVEFLDAA